MVSSVMGLPRDTKNRTPVQIVLLVLLIVILIRWSLGEQLGINE